MIVVLDTNHFTEFADASTLGRKLMRSVEKQQAEVFSCIVAVEETMRGWLALLNRCKPGRDQLHAYAMFQQGLETLMKLTVFHFDEEAAAIYHRLRHEHRRAGTMDLKIAAICIAHDATLLSRNLVDFKDISGLRVENWLD